MDIYVCHYSVVFQCFQKNIVMFFFETVLFECFYIKTRTTFYLELINFFSYFSTVKTKMAVQYTIVIAILVTIAVPTIQLANCPNSCHCNDDTLIVECGEGHLDVLPIALNPSIKRLAIKNNKIKTIDSSIQFYAELTLLDLSYNHLFNIPPRTFYYQKKLQELHLNHNKIGSISNKTFTGLSSLTVLNLRGNFLDELSKGIFTSLSNVEEINIGQNRISRIDSNAFEGLVNLRILYLDDNTLTTVPSSSFVFIPNLAELYLGINTFSTVGHGAFENLKQLNQLDLRSSSLNNISLDTFKGLDAVRVLDLSDNRLERIPTVELSKLTRLESLVLGQNDFTIIPEGAFFGMTNLKRIDISGSLKLTKVQSGAFATNPNLESIILTANKGLVEVQEGALSGLPHLNKVILRGNSLTTLAEGLFPWYNLETFDLTENPIICDCRLAWLRNLLASRNITQTQEHVLCAAPERLREEPLKVLSLELLGCSHMDSRRQAMVGVILVGVAALTTTLLLISYKCRRQIRELIKGRWGNTTLSQKEREYQKTFTDEDYMYRHPHQCSFSGHPTLNHYTHHHPGLRSIPITEL